MKENDFHNTRESYKVEVTRRSYDVQIHTRCITYTCTHTCTYAHSCKSGTHTHDPHTHLSPCNVDGVGIDAVAEHVSLRMRFLQLCL